MPTPSETLTAKIKLWTAIVALIGGIIALATGIIYLTLACLGNASSKESEISKTSDGETAPQIETTVTDAYSREDNEKKDVHHPSPIFAQNKYDTVKILVPSRLQLEEVILENDKLQILSKNPISVSVRFLHKDVNRTIVLIGKNHQCTINQFFSGNDSIGLSLQDCQQK